MLASLKIKDIAIIDELDISFCPHLNIITGETGQIAAFADRHFFVKKEIRDERTVTRVKVLEGDERIDEIARMLGGGKGAIEHAREMIKIGGSI